MTTRQELEPIVGEWLHRTLDAIPEPVHRYPLVASEVNRTPQQRRWLPAIGTGRFNVVLSATRLVVAGVIVALFSGTLLAGVLTSRQSESPALVGSSPSATPTAEASEASGATPEPAADGDIVVARDGSGDHASIVRAIAAARDGDTIRVRPGRYEEQLDIRKAIAVVGDGPRDEVVIVAVGDWVEPSGDRRNPVVEVRDANARLADLTILDERETGYGPPPSEIALTGRAEPVVERVSVELIHIGERNRAIVRDNDVDTIGTLASDSPTIEGNRAGRIDIDGSADLHAAPVRNALVVDNVVSDGVRLVGFGHLVSGNRIGHIVDESQGSLIRDNEVGSIELTGLDTVVRENVVSGADNGIVVIDPGAGVTVEANDVSGRRLGIVATGAGPMTIRENVVHDSDIGLLVATTSGQISGNRVCGNREDVVRTWEAEIDLEANEVCQPEVRVAGEPDADAIEGTTERDSNGFVFEALAPGIRRFVHDDAGHMVGARWILSPRDVVHIEVEDDRDIRVWVVPTDEGEDTDISWRIDRAPRMWTLGVPGETVDRSWTWERDPDLEAGPIWALGTRALDRDGPGARRIVERLGAREDGMLWAIVATRNGRRPARFDGESWTVFPPPPGPGVIQLGDGMIDADGRLWFGRERNDGLGIYDGRSVRTVGVGLPIVPGPFDEEGRMWGRLWPRPPGGGPPHDIVVIDADLVEEARSDRHIEDAELAARFPGRLAGRDLEIVTLTGEQWLRQFQPRPRQQPPPRPELDAFLEAAEASIGDLTMGYTSFEPSPGNRAFLVAVRVSGAEASVLVDPLIPLMLGNLEEPETRSIEVAGKSVVRITDAAVPGVYPQYAYAVGDTVWLIDAEEPVLSETLAALP